MCVILQCYRGFSCDIIHTLLEEKCLFPDWLANSGNWIQSQSVFSTEYDFFGSQLFLSLTCTLSIYSSKAEEHKPKNFITGKCCYTIYLYTTIKLETCLSSNIC